jgi:6,7-dimethyl-8-ribityllumazine synthase
MAEVANSRLYHLTSGITLPRNACVVIVRTEWNATIVDELEKGARRILDDNNAQEIVVINVPGAVEIPFAVHKYWDAHKYKDDRPQAFITLGCIIRGGTPHFEYVCRSVTDGITQLNLSLPVPVIFGVLTVDNSMQADERLGGPYGHKGEEAAITALKMIAVAETIVFPKNVRAK